MSSNYSIIIDKGEHHGDYVRHVFRALFSGPNSYFNHSAKITKDDLDTRTEILSEDLIQNNTESYNNMVAAK